MATPVAPKIPTLRSLLEQNGLLQAPGAYDALTARVIVAAGFPVVYMTGYGTAASHGYPDIGLVTMTEMVANAARIVEAACVPVIADADTGYGNHANVKRCVREFERAGVAAIHLEDQTWPKRCGHMEGKEVVPVGEMVSKLKAAVDTRHSEDFLIIARSDAIAVEGFEAAIERGHAYAEAGADILFIEAPVDREQLAEIPRRLPQRPQLVNLAPRTPLCSKDELETFGFALAIYPGLCLTAALTACMAEAEHLKKTGLPRDPGNWRERFDERNDFFGLAEYASTSEDEAAQT